MAFKIAFVLALPAAVVHGASECAAGECGEEESTLLALRQNSSSATRRRLPSVTCTNPLGDEFQCAGGDSCCVWICVGQGDLCCTNYDQQQFPCQGGGSCCGNACAAPGSKCCKPDGPKSGWYPVSDATQCREESTQCTNAQGHDFECAAGDRCCGGTCVHQKNACCTNVNGDSFSCQVNEVGEGGCCGNACYAPGSKCCRSAWVAETLWYPVAKGTKCRWD